MIRTVAVNCTYIVLFWRDDRNTTVETASEALAMEVVYALFALSLHVSQQNHSDLSLKVLYNTLKSFYQKQGNFKG